MSKIYEKLREAEAERERVVAERKRLEAEADAALAEREREERLERAGVARPATDSAHGRAAAARSKTESRGLPMAWLGAVTTALVAGVAIGVLVPKKAAPRLEPAAPVVQAGALPLKLDRDLDAFSARLATENR